MVAVSHSQCGVRQLPPAAWASRNHPKNNARDTFAACGEVESMCNSTVDREGVCVTFVVVWWFALADEKLVLSTLTRKEESREECAAVVCLVIGVVVADSRACVIVVDHLANNERVRGLAGVNNEVTNARSSSNGITTVGIEVSGGGWYIVAPWVVKAEAVCAHVRDVNRTLVVTDSVGDVGSSRGAVELGDGVWSSVRGLPLITDATWCADRRIACRRYMCCFGLLP